MVLTQTTNNTGNQADNRALPHTHLAKDTCLAKELSKRRICIYDGGLQVIRALLQLVEQLMKQLMDQIMHRIIPSPYRCTM